MSDLVEDKDFVGGLGRIEVPDDRDMDFPVGSVLQEAEQDMPPIKRRFWWADGWWGNQGTTSQCVVYSWSHYIEDGPVVQDALTEDRRKPMFDLYEFYKLCQENDRWPGENYDGTAVRAGAKILQHMGVVKSYRWANNIDEVIRTIKYVGPMVVGTRWYENMNRPTADGIVKPTGRQIGGHAYVLNGIDDDLGLIRIKNSWGRGWGKNGFGYISFEDFEKLLKNGGEACIAFENKLTEVPELLFG